MSDAEHITTSPSSNKNKRKYKNKDNANENSQSSRDTSPEPSNFSNYQNKKARIEDVNATNFLESQDI